MVLSTEEAKALRQLYPPGITLLGFKARASLKDHHNLKHAQFVFPDDRTIKGSTTTFLALLHCCLVQDKVRFSYFLSLPCARLSPVY